MEKLYPILFWSETHPAEPHRGKAKTAPSEAVAAVVKHLKKGRVHRTRKKPYLCQLCGLSLGPCEMTDGDVVWPEKAHHYITAHKVWSPEHFWLAQRLLLDTDEPPIPRESPMEEEIATPQVVPETPGVDWAELGAMAAASSWASSMETDADPEPAPESVEVDPWTLNEGKLEAMSKEVFSSVQIKKTVVASEEVSSAPVETRSDIPASPRRRRRPPATRTSSNRRPVRPSSLDVRPSTGENVPAQPSSSPTSLVLADHQEESMHPDAYGATDFAAAIAAAYPRAGHALALKIVEVAGQVGAHPYDLANLIQFESAKTFSSSEPNPDSGAIGLIQFYPGLTQRNIGITVEKLARMSELEQMKWVKIYLDKMRNGQPLNTPHKVAMAVFYPKALGWPPTQRFPAKVTQNNPGPPPIYTPQDYARLLARTAKLPSSDQMPAYHPLNGGGGGGGLVSDLTSWWSGLWGPSAGEQAVTPKFQAQAQWSSTDPTVNARLVSVTSGGVFPPGALEAGHYQLEAWDSKDWVPVAPVQISQGRSYVLSVQQGRLKWSET